MKNMNELAKALCEAEGGKKEVNIAQVKEILKLISTAIWTEPQVLLLLLKNGKRITEKSHCALRPRHDTKHYQRID